MKPADIPKYGDYYRGESIKAGPYEVRVKVKHDEHMGPPWKEHDGHGPVSEWTSRDKALGELILIQDGRSKRYYDFAAAVRQARKEEWDAPPYKTGTAGERAYRAARADFERLRQWCNGEWYWVGVIVEVFRNGESVGQDSLWGIESDGDYWREAAAEMANELMRQHRREVREARHWAARGMLTT